MSFNLDSFQSIMNKHNKLLLHLFHLVEKLPAEVACFYFTIAKATEARIRYTDHATRKPFKFIATAPMQSIFVEGPFDRFDWRIRMLLYHLSKHVIHYGIVVTCLELISISFTQPSYVVDFSVYRINPNAIE